MPRRILTEEEKRAYEERVTGKVSKAERIRKSGRKIGVLVALALVLGFGVYWLCALRPTPLSKVVGVYNEVEFAEDFPSYSVEEMKRWEVKRAYPAWVGDLRTSNCTLYLVKRNEETGEEISREVVETLVFYYGESFFVKDGEIYSFEENPLVFEINAGGLAF